MAPDHHQVPNVVPDQDLAVVLPMVKQDHVQEVTHNIHDHDQNLTVQLDQDLVRENHVQGLVRENHVQDLVQENHVHNQDPVPDLVLLDPLQVLENHVHVQDQQVDLVLDQVPDNQDPDHDQFQENQDHVLGLVQQDPDLVQDQNHDHVLYHDHDHVLDQDQEDPDHVRGLVLLDQVLGLFQDRDHVLVQDPDQEMKVLGVKDD